MARKLRLEFPGACYHVINRGNYRSDIFKTEGARAAFEECLFEACAKSGWVLHAFVLMRNHYHLALATPAGNLVGGSVLVGLTYHVIYRRGSGPQLTGRRENPAQPGPDGVHPPLGEVPQPADAQHQQGQK